MKMKNEKLNFNSRAGEIFSKSKASNVLKREGIWERRCMVEAFFGGSQRKISQ